MTYMQCVKAQIKNYKIGEPIFTSEISKVLAEEFQIDFSKACSATAVVFKRLLEKGIISNLRFYQNGVYYLTKDTPDGESKLDMELLLEKKYTSPSIGYESGQTLLYELKIINKKPAKRIIISNVAGDCIRKDAHLNIYVKPPKTEVTSNNICYLQLLDSLDLLEKVKPDVDDPYTLLKTYISTKQLNYELLLSLANKYYSKKVIMELAEVASC